MVIKEYLGGLFDFKFSDENFNSVLATRNVEPNTHFSEVSERDKDIMVADLYMILSSVASGGGKKVQMGNRSVSESTFTFGVNDRTYFRNQANKLYAKWGEERQSKGVKFVGIHGH